MAAVLKVYRIRRFTVDTIREALQTPAVHVAPGTVEAASAHIALLLPRLRLLHEQRTKVAGRIDALLEELCKEDGPGEHRDITILRSLPGVGRVVAATVLAEAARPLAERDYQLLRAHGGIAPVTRQSGKRSPPGQQRQRPVHENQQSGHDGEDLVHARSTARFGMVYGQPEVEPIKRSPKYRVAMVRPGTGGVYRKFRPYLSLAPQVIRGLL